jgi:hypothetical protein
MAFGQSIQKIELQTTSLKKGLVGGNDNPSNNIESIRRDPYGVDGSPQDNKEDRCIFWVETGASGWSDVKSASRIRSARIRVQATSTSSDTNNTIDFHSSGTGSNSVAANLANWADYAFRATWPVAGGNITTVSNSTSIPGGVGRWSGNVAEATKSMTASDYPLWVGKVNIESEPVSSAGDDAMNFYDENVIINSSRPHLLVVLGKEKMPRRLQAHRRRLT